MGKPKRIPMDGKLRHVSGLQVRAWRRQEKAGRDLQQTVFCPTASQDLELKGNPNRFATITEKGIDPFLNVRCPFCLSHMQLTKFLISLKSKKGKNKGYDRGKGKCPECGLGMQLKTLQKMRDWMLAKTPEDGVKKYAAWVFEYRSSGFWQEKIDKYVGFEKFCSMLTSMKWADAFFKEYNRLKGDLPDEETQKKYDALADAYEESFN